MDMYDENSSIFRFFSGVLIAVRWSGALGISGILVNFLLNTVCIGPP
jgi:hypothetical protein